MLKEVWNEEENVVGLLHWHQVLGGYFSYTNNWSKMHNFSRLVKGRAPFNLTSNALEYHFWNIESTLTCSSFDNQTLKP